ncbi:MAG: tetratricopeptide repeat protein, partial [Desulfobacterota bacterium]|nr:tetratricopeptide repeat protein [Thermodesulfobacteriota bacterium]
MFATIRIYLASPALEEKDRLLRTMRRLAESGSPDREELEGFGPAGSSGETWPEGPEGQGLLLLLSGYRRMAGYDYPGAEEALEKVIPLIAREHQPPLLYLGCCAGLGRTLSLSERGLNHQALQRIKSLKPLLDRLALPALKGEARHLQALALRRLGRNAEALAELNRALGLFQQTLDDYWIARVEDTLGVTTLDLGQMDQAELHLQRALARKVRLGDLPGQAYTLGNLGRYFASQERDDLAAHYLKRELELSEKL